MEENTEVRVGLLYMNSEINISPSSPSPSLPQITILQWCLVIATGDGYQTNEPWGDRKISISCDLDFDSQRGESTACKASRVSIPMLDGAVVAWDSVRRRATVFL